MSNAIIEVNHLSKTFGTHQVLKDVDFTVNAGDVTCIIGASGSGKSTLLRCINLLERPTGGEILFHGTPITGRHNNPSRYRAKVGMVFQSFNLFQNMTVLDNCMVGPVKVLKENPAVVKERAMSFLEKVGDGAVYQRKAAPAFRRTKTACSHRPRFDHAAGSAFV